MSVFSFCLDSSIYSKTLQQDSLSPFLVGYLAYNQLIHELQFLPFQSFPIFCKYKCPGFALMLLEILLCSIKVDFGVEKSKL